MKVIPFTIPVAHDNAVIVQEDNLPHFYPHLHRHNEAQLTWIQQGIGTLIAGNYMQPFREGDLYVIGANQPHVFKSDEKYFDKRRKESVRSLTIFFNPSGFFKPLLELPEMKTVSKFVDSMEHGIKFSGKINRTIQHQMLAVASSKSTLRLAGFLELLHKMSGTKELAILATGVTDQTLSDKEGLRMNDVYQFTLTNFRKPVTLDEVAAIAYMTPPAFCRYFKKHTGKTYVTFLNEMRIAEACKMVTSQPQLSFASIAYESGFITPIHFNRVFKKVMGTTPGEYQKTANF